MSSRRPDAVVSSFAVKSEDITADPSIDDFARDAEEDDDDPVVREIDVYLSPSLSNTLHLLQFPIQPAASVLHKNTRYDTSNNPTEAKFRPRHHMLELEYPIPPNAQAGHRQISDKLCLASRTFTSNSVTPVTHMALAKLNRSGERFDIIPLRQNVLQMRPSFRHLHDEEEDDPNHAAADEADNQSAPKQRPVMFNKKESERAMAAKRNSYAYKCSNEESEEWIELDVHGSQGTWSQERKALMKRASCPDREKQLQLSKRGANCINGDGGYVKSLNYLASSGGSDYVENLSDWNPAAVEQAVPDSSQNDDEDGNDVEMEDVEPTAQVGKTEQATAELAGKLAVLLQTGNGTMVPYRVLRSRFHPSKVSDEMLVNALSACACIVRGNFAMKSSLAKFLKVGGVKQRKIMCELRDLILIILNVHGSIQRERLTKAYVKLTETNSDYDVMNVDTITFILKTVARKGDNCWVGKVQDDDEFAGQFPSVAQMHAEYWAKKRTKLDELMTLYEEVKPERSEGSGESEDAWFGV